MVDVIVQKRQWIENFAIAVILGGIALFCATCELQFGGKYLLESFFRRLKPDGRGSASPGTT